MFGLNAAAASKSFTDVSNNHSNKNEINYLVEKGIINGYKDGSFKPGNTVTNGQVAMMVARALNINLTNRPNPGFSDVSSKTSGYKEIAALVDEGIIPKEKNFKPGSPILRDSMARILVNAFKLKGGSSVKFSDVRTDNWAYGYIATLAANGITTGYPDGTFKPKNTVTRGNFSAFMARSLDPVFKPVTKELRISDLSIGGLIPNKDIVSSIGTFQGKYNAKFNVESLPYFTGDPNSSMSWFLSIMPDKNGNMIKVEYEQFNDRSKVIPNANIKGIKVGSTLDSVYKLFGKSKSSVRETASPYHYVDLSYDLKMKDTGQSVKVGFSLRHKTNQSESQATVYGLSYELSPVKEVIEKPVEKPVVKPQPPIQDKNQIVYNGKTIKVGMTKSQVSKLLGKAQEVNRPMGATQKERNYMEQLLGTDFFNMVDIEQWSYIQNKGSYVEALVIFFNYKGIVTDVYKL